jgi:hypothetical protein
MATLNENIKSFKCLIRVSHLTKNEKDRDKFHDCYAFAIQSISGKILTFHVMTDYGMLRSRVPLSEIFLKEPITAYKIIGIVLIVAGVYFISKSA